MLNDDHHVRQAPVNGGSSAARPTPRVRNRYDAAEDAALAVKVASGSRAAFRHLVDRHLAFVVAVARNVVGDGAEAEDIGQEAFLRLWKSAGSLKIGADGIRPWLGRVARNLAIDYLRSRKRLEDRDETPELVIQPSQQDHVEAGDRRARVRQAIDQLPDRQRVALTLFHFEAFSQADVADALQVSQDAVESLLARARRRLKKELEQDWRALIEGTGDEN